jgi:uncharacterized OsmC-like protein
MSEPASATTTRLQKYQFRVEFGPNHAPIIADEPPPLGDDAGPTPQHFLAAAVANCLAASLLFAFQKYKEDPGPISANVTCFTGRNEENRLRILNIDVKLNLDVTPEKSSHLARILASFDDFCTVTRSVEHGIPIALAVLGPDGTALR